MLRARGQANLETQKPKTELCEARYIGVGFTIQKQLHDGIATAEDCDVEGAKGGW